jgi:16S rRNA (adenine1518-N6/adenine1519-N6)-dimethyltransferase
VAGKASRRPRSARPSRWPAPPTTIRELRKAGAFAKKSLGQHFLTDQRALRRIAQAALPSSGGTVIEIGAGLGDLTSALAARASHVIAIEKDDLLAPRLEARFAGSNVTIVHADALDVAPGAVLRDAGARPPYVVAGNLPYNVAQPILRHYLEAVPRPERLVVMVQAEVAESIVAKPGDMTLLGLSVQLYGQPHILFRVPPSAFYPPPNVESAVIQIDVSDALRAPVDDIDAFFRVARAAFGTKRKQLRNALAAGLAIDPPVAATVLSRAGIQHAKRAQELTLDEWAALTRAWDALGRPGGGR